MLFYDLNTLEEVPDRYRSLLKIRAADLVDARGDPRAVALAMRPALAELGAVAGLAASLTEG